MLDTSHVIIIILLLVVIYLLYTKEHFSSRPDYIGHPLVDSINDSGADLRILGTEFSSVDQGN
jgi:hypothetical protein